MQTAQGNILASLRNVQRFLDDHAAELPGIADSGARKKLDALVVALDAHADTQSGSDTSAKTATQKHRALRTALIRDHMAPIAKIAAAELPDTPELQPLKLPQGRPSAERLKALAKGMGEAAAPFADVFVSMGRPADFLAQLNTAADAMLGPVTERKVNRVVRAGATMGLASTLAHARRVVHAIDASVKSALTGNASLLAGWNVAKRVELVSGRPRTASAPAPTPAPAPAPATSPTPAPAPTVAPTPAPAPIAAAA